MLDKKIIIIISAFLEENHPGQRGFSVQSVERYCSSKGIHKTSRIDDNKQDEVLSNATDMVNTVCHYFLWVAWLDPREGVEALRYACK